MSVKNQPDLLLQKDLSYIKEKVDAIERKLEANYMTKDEGQLLKQEFLAKLESFDTVKKFVYGLIGLVLTAVFGALISLVIMK